MFVWGPPKVALVLKNLPASAGSLTIGKVPQRRAWQPTPVFLPGESHAWTEERGGLQSIGSQRVGHD